MNLISKSAENSKKLCSQLTSKNTGLSSQNHSKELNSSHGSGSYKITPKSQINSDSFENLEEISLIDIFAEADFYFHDANPAYNLQKNQNQDWFSDIDLPDDGFKR